MEQQNMDLMQPTPVSEPVSPELTQKPPVSVRDRVLAIALLIFGYLVCRFQIHDHPLLGLIYGLVLYGLTLWHFRGRMGKRALTVLAVGILLLLSHLLTDNGPVRFFARWFALLLWGYGVYCAGGNSAEERVGDMLVPELFKANVLMPVSKLGAFFTAVFSDAKRNWLRTALMILLGLGMALVPLVLVVNLLEYDHTFSKLIDSLFCEDLPELIFRCLRYLVLAVGMATLLMSVIQGSEEHRMARVLDRERWNAFRIRRRFMPVIVSAAMLIPLLLVYGLFFFSQWPLYTSAFTGTLPQGWTYADYAREGFFQLCIVCAINGLLYLFVNLFTRMGKGAAVQRTLLTILCLCSLVLAATAFSKMVLYIRTYGLTPLRVYSSWAMVLLVAAFLVALVGAYWKKLNMARALFLLFTVMFGFLCLSDTNALIADYNVRAYERGQLSEVDVSVFGDLGDSAVPAAVRLVDDPVYGERVQHFLSHQGGRTFFGALSHGIPGLRARAICAPFWFEQTTVRVRIETEDSFEALSCSFWANGYSYDPGTCVNADGTPFRRGQSTFFELEEQPQNVGMGDEVHRDSPLRVCLKVTDDRGNRKPTNWLDCTFGGEIHVTLTGNADEGYRIKAEN